MLEERVCPACGEKYLPLVEYCTKDDQPLSIASTLIGKVLDQRYRLDQIIGFGGMGVVYRATHIKTNQERAVKVLQPEMMEKEGMLRRFQTEAIAAAKIENEKAVKIVDFQVTEDKLAYLVMEMVEGIVLRKMITPQGMDYQRTVEIMCQICEAVHAAHEKKIIHRDLKPDNVIVKRVGNEDRVKVLDFGIAKLREVDQADSANDPLTKIGTIMGTPQYMSPEQCSGIHSDELKPTSDVYSMGVIAYELLCGIPPFIGANILELLDKQKHLPPPHIKTINPKVPMSVAEVVMQSLAKAPEQRWPTAEKLAQELRIAVREARGGKTKSGEFVITEFMHGSLPTTPLSPSDQSGQFAGHRETKPIEPAQAPADQSNLAAPNVQASFRLSWWKPALAAVAVLLLIGISVYWIWMSKHKPSIPSRIEDLPKTVSDEFGEMLLIIGGKFTMGNDNGAEDERPTVPKEVGSFYLDKYEVTNQQYKKFVDARNYPKPEHWGSGSYKSAEASYPVTHVTWSDAQAYAKWTGKRLPTEAEWEYAARGGEKGYLFPWGNEWSERANYATNKLAVRGAYADDVGPFGVFDLGGNVSEWVEDKFLFYDAKRPVNMDSPDDRVLRGGNFGKLKAQGITQITNTARIPLAPELPSDSEAKESYRKNYFPFIGFRCAKDASAVK